MEKFKVKNLPLSWRNYKFMVIRDCGNNEYWYYGIYNELPIAHKAANEIGNGILVETKQVEQI